VNSHGISRLRAVIVHAIINSTNHPLGFQNSNELVFNKFITDEFNASLMSCSQPTVNTVLNPFLFVEQCNMTEL